MPDPGGCYMGDGDANLDYQDFLAVKNTRQMADAGGLTVDDSEVSGQLFDFQRDIVRWALNRGRAAIFAECGLGKTPMQLEWARHVHEATKGDLLILAPLAVTSQTKRE